ncbi:cathepsin L1-like [Copidosoma floridanum]|uniref:cathepsin L1-like n=1 Tax=Copidosoma floridanum TaxID=29053 RepID=UPI0006C98C59|nr:cathepsin L1-like [Copidosoma floridanum]
MIFSVFFFLVATAAAVHSAAIYEVDVTDEWELYKLQYNKNYESPTEEKKRFKIFMDNRQKIVRHNKRYEQGLVTFSMAMNKFGDMTVCEFSSKVNGFVMSRRSANFADESEGAAYLEPANVGSLPDHVDWRDKGAVTPVKDQGECGSCWAFSATGSLEGQHFRRNGTLVSLSEQNLIDCSSKFGNMGCDGGLMDNAFKYIKYNHGLDKEQSYPYEARDDKCRYNPANSGADDAGYVDLPSGNENKLQTAVATVGPISVAIDADHDSFMFYSKGIYYEPLCSSEFLDHGVLVVGYGTDQKSNKQFWLVKNSWGEAWGDQGYIKMSRNRHNNCGIATSASYPLVK